MTKRLFAICLVASLMASSSAFASRARLMVLGTADQVDVINRGSFYYEDAYNLFYNPAYINDFTNWAAVEKSNGNANTMTGGSNQAEGGFVTSMGNVNIGLYFNRGDALTGNIYTNTLTSAAAGTSGTDLIDDMRPIDLTIGGEVGPAKLGIGLTQAYAKDPNGASANHWGLRAGASVMDFDPFVSFQLVGKNKAKLANVNRETKNSDMAIGARYHYGEWVPYAAYKSQENKFESVIQTTTKIKREAFGGGIGRNMKLSDMFMMNYAMSYWRTKTSNTSTVAGSSSSTKRSVVPVDLALEAELASWVTARGGVSYNFWDRFGGGANTTATPATGRMGASFHFNKVDVDFAVGNNGGTATTENPDATTFALDNGLFTAAALTYHW